MSYELWDDLPAGLDSLLILIFLTGSVKYPFACPVKCETSEVYLVALSDGTGRI